MYRRNYFFTKNKKIYKISSRTRFLHLVYALHARKPLERLFYIARHTKSEVYVQCTQYEIEACQSNQLRNTTEHNSTVSISFYFIFEKLKSFK